MEFFTQTVDSSLWVSRAFDDEAYDDDEAAAELGALPFDLEFCGDQKGHLTVDGVLVCTVGAASAFATAAVTKGDPVAVLKSKEAKDIRVHFVEKTAVLALKEEIAPHRAYQLARAIFTHLKPKKVVVLTALPAWKLNVEDDTSELFCLMTTKQDKTLVSNVARAGVLPTPGMLDGVAAAVLNEAEWLSLPGVALIGAEHSIRMSGAALSRFQAPVEFLLGLSIDPRIDYAGVAETQFDVTKANIYL